jgi:hypothetical protein
MTTFNNRKLIDQNGLGAGDGVASMMLFGTLFKTLTKQQLKKMEF